MNHYLNKTFNLDDEQLVSVIDELPLWSAPFGLSLLKTIRLRKNIRVLDIGFGLGFPLLEVAMRLGESCKVFGIDPWKMALKRTRSKIKQYGINNVELIEGFAEEIPLESNSIDLIISNNGTNNVADLNKTFSECARVAKRNAQFVFTVNLPETMMEFYSIFEEVMVQNNLDKVAENMHLHIYEKRKPVSEIELLLQKNEFSISGIQNDSFTINFVDGSSMFSHFLISLAFLDSWKNLVPPEYRNNIFDEIEKRMNDKAEKEGSFSLSVPFATFNCFKD